MNITELSESRKKIFTDKIISSSIYGESIIGKYCCEPFKNSVYTRVFVVGENIIIKNISFEHSYFIDCKLRKVRFENCSFVNCFFNNCDFSRSSFINCDFKYSNFKNTIVDVDIFNSAPREHNLLLKFAISLRINYRELGQKNNEDIATQHEINANRKHLYDSWKSKDPYYRKKYQGFERFEKFIEWIYFKLNDLIWGNGESLTRLILSGILLVALLSIIATISMGNNFSLNQIVSNIINSLYYFIGSIDNQDIKIIFKNSYVQHMIVIFRTIFFGLLISILIRKYSRR